VHIIEETVLAASSLSSSCSHFCAAEDAEAVAAVSEEAPAAAAVPAGAGKTKIKDYLIEIVLFFMLILLHHTAS
jgi:hypothetical protein